MISWAKFSQQYIFSPTGLSLSRGVIALFLPFLILSTNPWNHFWAFLLFIVGAITDFFDGWLARKFNLITSFGKIIDPTTDKMLFLIPLAVFCKMGLYSPWWLVPIFGREILVTFCRIGWLMDGKAIQAEKMGKIKFGFQVALIITSFLYLLSFNFAIFNLLQSLAYLCFWLFLYIVFALTVSSGVQFFRANYGLLLSQSFAKYLEAVGVGLLPKAPGTWGSLAGLGIIALVHWNVWLYLGTFAFILSVGYWAFPKLNVQGHEDPQYIVIDEVLGMFVTFFLVPFSASTALIGFVLFRLFDIVKPFPLRKLEKVPGYWGIILDDLGAGVYGWLVLIISFQLL